jgi:hypothetical protein
MGDDGRKANLQEKRQRQHQQGGTAKMQSPVLSPSSQNIEELNAG